MSATEIITVQQLEPRQVALLRGLASALLAGIMGVVAVYQVDPDPTTRQLVIAFLLGFGPILAARFGLEGTIDQGRARTQRTGEPAEPARISAAPTDTRRPDGYR